MATKYKVVSNAMLVYGSVNKAHIFLNKGQIWELTEKIPRYILSRNNIEVEVYKEDFERIFKKIERGE